ncbi:response regulator [Deinococcus hopiensis]|uniref:CheY chemotaxis protein or a CheY-like REC (Receiver) domain n=1 Tax=Deinococcus hopiensis KR-140 TaxID=695939 RepID=A0A1W1UPU9_9DEIO|nr:response regulator [Deinococcus hopiensis]SMB83096.1 CheY chemotaxis protein or a CheY-like REC (receiver) domain [Deinococcus hopiensis KR-140]
MTSPTETPWLLVVEDNASELLLLEMALEELGIPPLYEVVRDGQEALLRLQQAPAPELVLMDINMPCLSGEEVLQALGNSLQGTQVVAWSVGWKEGDVAHMQALGASAYVGKPHTYEALLELVRGLWAARPVGAKRALP